MDFRDFPEQAIVELNTANRDYVEELFNVAMQVVALCQQNLNLHGVFLSIQSNGDILISIVQQTGTGTVAYARVNRINKKIDIIGHLPTP